MTFAALAVLPGNAGFIPSDRGVCRSLWTGIVDTEIAPALPTPLRRPIPSDP